jgi:hypothetical protein
MDRGLHHVDVVRAIPARPPDTVLIQHFARSQHQAAFSPGTVARTRLQYRYTICIHQAGFGSYADLVYTIAARTL